MAIDKIDLDALGADASKQGVNFKNKIINGDISVSQRGTSFSNVASGDYTIDRWNMSYRAVGNADIAQVDNKTYKSLKVTNSNGSAQEIIMRYRVEDITQFHNDSFILSFFAKASTSCTLDTRVFENYGSGGSTTVTAVASGSQNKTITTSRQRFTITFTASDMSSKTIGTSNFLEINFSVSLASGANWEYDSVQLEQGTTASDFEFIPFDVNLQRCKRYYQLIASGNDVPFGMGAYYTGSNLYNSQKLSPSMRTAPSVDQVTGTNYYILYNTGGNGNDEFNSLNMDVASDNFVNLNNSSEVSGSAGQAGIMRTRNANSYLAISAEL